MIHSEVDLAVMSLDMASQVSLVENRAFVWSCQRL
jgi:hypothetical protein